MCQICTDYIKGSLTREEAYKNLTELSSSLPPDHAEFVKLIIDDGTISTLVAIEQDCE